MIQALIVSPHPWPWRFLLTKMNDFNIQFIHWITKWKYTMYIQCKAAFCTCLFIFSDKWLKKMTKAFLCKCIYSRSTMKWSFIHIPKVGTNKKELQWTWFWEFFQCWWPSAHSKKEDSFCLYFLYEQLTLKSSATNKWSMKASLSLYMETNLL